MTAIAILHKALICEKVAQGVRLEDIGLGITHQSISQALKDDPDYQLAKISYHAARLDKAEGMIEDADDQTAVARARALHSAYAWRAEREARDVWGKGPDVVINAGPNMSQAMDGLVEAALDRLSVVSHQVPEKSDD